MGKTLKPFASVFLKLVLGSMLLCAIPVSAQSRWTAEMANAWYAAQPWLSGANFSPSTAINQLEMWQAESFDLATLDRELGWAKQLGFNSRRVFLQDLVWKQDPEAFIQRLDQFLAVADKHGIRVMFVLFDGVWDPHPKLGRQRDPMSTSHSLACGFPKPSSARRAFRG